MTDRVLLTGGTGFVGGAILDRLLADGREVRALARTSEAAAELKRRGAEPVRGDLLDRSALVAGAKGCAVVYHTAGLNAFCLADPAPLFRVNLQGSINLLEAAAAAGVARMVYTSSAATIGEPAGTVGREDSPHRGWFLSHYERSKYEAERAVLGTAVPVQVVCVNPSSVQGPGRTTGSARLILSLLNGDLKVLVESRLSLVDVTDCVEGHLLAERHGVAGERYLLNGVTITMTEAMRMLSELTGLELDVFELPPIVARVGAALVELSARLARKDPPFCREMVRTILHGHTYDGSRATRELGLEYTPVRDTLRRTVVWYADHGHLRRPLPKVAG